MKARYRKLVLCVGLIAAGGWWHYRIPEATVLSLRVGQPFREVVKNSTYPVMERSNVPSEDPMKLQAGETFVTEPAVILRFDDPRHGFRLPPTKFALVGYMHNRVDTVATTPMLGKLPFDEAVAVLEDIQNQLKAGGWEPWAGDKSEWFDFTPEGKKRLYARMFVPGFMETQSLRVPNKYGMTFRLWCAEGCWTREPPYLFLIDVGVSSDTHTWWDKEPKK
jgi:hypothetical protein